jgi:hypothetical protein
MKLNFSDKAKASLQTCLKRFEEGDFSTIAEIALLKRNTDIPFDRWSFSNKVIAWAQSGTLDCRGYRQWEQVGRRVKKGSRAVYILAPLITKIEDEETGETFNKCYGFKGVPIFSVNDTEGDPIDYGYEDVEPPPLIEVAKAFDLDVTYEPLIGAYGAANLKTGNIRLATAEEQVFFHELVHAIRVKGGMEIKDEKDYAREEVIAEFGATVLAEMYGKDISGHAIKYIKHYSEGKDPVRIIIGVLHEVEKVLKEIANIKEMELA